MPAPEITPLPPAPIRSESPATFNAKAEAFVAALEDLPTEINAFGSYLDGLGLEGTSWKQAVRVATTANGTLASGFENGDTIDGVVLATGDRILIKNQSSGAENGIYVVAASGAPSRATDVDTGAEMLGMAVFVTEGTTNADTLWFCTTNATITIGSTALVFSQIGASVRPIAFFFTTAPTASEVLLLYTACENISLADDFAGSVGDVGTNPTASFALDVQKNGSSIGSITVSTGGTFTFATTDGAVSLVSGDQLKIVGPGSADATIANVSITLKGTV